MKHGQSAQISVLMADDHAMVRKGIRDFLAEDTAIKIVGEASDGAAAWRLLVQSLPEVAVIDIRMPGVTGIELTRRIKEQYPAVRMLILTAYDDEPYVMALLRAGADVWFLIENTLMLCEGKRAMSTIAGVIVQVWSRP